MLLFNFGYLLFPSLQVESVELEEDFLDAGLTQVIVLSLYDQHRFVATGRSPQHLFVDPPFSHLLSQFPAAVRLLRQKLGDF